MSWDGRNHRASHTAGPLQALSCRLHNDIRCHRNKETEANAKPFPLSYLCALVRVESNLPFTPRNISPPITFLLSLLGYFEAKYQRNIYVWNAGLKLTGRKQGSRACVGKLAAYHVAAAAAAVCAVIGGSRRRRDRSPGSPAHPCALGLVAAAHTPHPATANLRYRLPQNGRHKQCRQMCYNTIITRPWGAVHTHIIKFETTWEWYPE